MPMNSIPGEIPNPNENDEDLAPSKLCTNSDSNFDSNSPSVKQRRDYLKQEHGRRRKWWYFNRGLQPISEAVENKDDLARADDGTLTIIKNLESNGKSQKITNKAKKNLAQPKELSPEILDEKVAISDSNCSFPQAKEGYSACFKLIEKFQEAVIDSAVRVIQAAFKRFRERRRFLRLKKAVTVIQRNVRKWLKMKHPCLRPAEFDQQSSDSAKSEEYCRSASKDVDNYFIKEDSRNDIETEVESTCMFSECQYKGKHVCPDEVILTVQTSETSTQSKSVTSEKQYVKRETERCESLTCESIENGTRHVNGLFDEKCKSKETCWDSSVQFKKSQQPVCTCTCSCESSEMNRSEDLESSLSAAEEDIDEGFSSMDLGGACDCCCVLAEMNGGLCSCVLPTGYEGILNSSEGISSAEAANSDLDESTSMGETS